MPCSASLSCPTAESDVGRSDEQSAKTAPTTPLTEGFHALNHIYDLYRAVCRILCAFVPSFALKVNSEVVRRAAVALRTDCATFHHSIRTTIQNQDTITLSSQGHRIYNPLLPSLVRTVNSSNQPTMTPSKAQQLLQSVTSTTHSTPSYPYLQCRFRQSFPWT